ncbi:agarase [Cellvibrio sp. KY-YJ-3]|uniref:agarase n=1 Tax=Cellvibrio sp. KY-YJ-3 TaxID=454662 RepID=UPI001245264A|nr:agarase [Cellvibrio sp. KY-YJ-3]QEY12856.1 agarase [Cellvibrio sp. KY-YJ-3]
MKLTQLISIATYTLILGGCGGGGGGTSTPPASSKASVSPTQSSTSVSSLVASSSTSLSSTPNSSVASTDSRPKISFNRDIKHIVGDIHSFDRRKFITIHSSNTEADWFGSNAQSLGAPNASPDLITEVMDGYDVYFGRDTGGITWQLGELNQDPARPGFVSESHAQTKGGDARWVYSNNANSAKIRQFENRLTDMIIGAQQHPFWPDGKLTRKGWALSQTDTPSEPFGTATGHYMGQYLAKYFSKGAGDLFGQPKPLYVEVMNEPLYDLVDASASPVPVEKVFQFHNTVAAEIRKTNSDVLIGGYTVAFPDYDKNDFQQWLNRDKVFIDLAGANMDFYSIHLYDFPAHNNREKYRRGSNVEATLDLLEQYDTIKFGKIKPLVISEYGASIHSMFSDPWTPQRDGLRLIAFNGLLMSFLERPNNIAKTIPFLPIKAEWGRVNGIPYNDRLMRQRKEAPGETGDEWVFTDMIKFYQLWSDVKGTRIDITSSDPDLVVNAYADNKRVYLIINNLEFNAQEFTLNDYSLNNPAFANATIKHLHLDSQNAPVLSETVSDKFPDSLSIGGSGTMIITMNYESAVVIDQTKVEQKTYATNYLQAIKTNSPLNFAINGITPAAFGEATLRLGIGRDHGKSLQPKVTINGTEVTVPKDYRGYDQYHQGKGRENFFGVIEIPVPYSILKANNQIEVTFADDGGHISSAALRAFHYSRNFTH